jgi:hypothetical protein
MSAADRPYTSPATREEKAEALRNEQMLRKQEASQPTTYHKLAGLSDDLGGRYRVKETITGEEKAAQYPAASSPWTAGNDAGLEMPTGQDVNFVEPCGEAHEVAASIVEQELGGEPTQSRDQELQIIGALEGSPPPSLTGTLAPAGDPSSAVKPMQAVLAPARVGETVPVNASTQPDDGLDVPRRSDGMPLSSHAINPRPRRKLK